MTFIGAPGTQPQRKASADRLDGTFPLLTERLMQIAIKQRQTGNILADLEGRITGVRQKSLIGTDLQNSGLVRADFAGMYLMHVNLDGAKLTGASFRRALMTGCTMRNADLSGADFGWGKPLCNDLSGSNLAGARLASVEGRGLKMENANARGIRMSGVFTDASLKGCDLRGADLRGASFGRADLQGADLRGARLRGMDPNVRSVWGLLFWLLAMPAVCIIPTTLERLVPRLFGWLPSGITWMSPCSEWTTTALLLTLSAWAVTAFLMTRPADADVDDADLYGAIYDETTVLPRTTRHRWPFDS